MNMEEIRELVKDIFERHYEKQKGCRVLTSETVLKVTDGEWHFEKYHSLSDDYMHNIVRLNSEQHKFVLRHARFLIAYCEYSIQNLSSEKTTDILSEITTRKKAFKILDRLSESVEGS